MRLLSAFAVTVFLSLASSQTHACRCQSLEVILSNFSSVGHVNRKREVFYGRVLRLTGPKEAEIKVLEVFVGNLEDKVIVRAVGDPALCGESFRVGEEAIFLTDEGRTLEPCSKFPSSATDLGTARDAFAKRK
jgi:hypothetical protein